MLLMPPPSWPLPLSPLGIRFISKGYSCLILKDKHKTTCIYTAREVTSSETFVHRAAARN
jgi:hypothetical protein